MKFDKRLHNHNDAQPNVKSECGEIYKRLPDNTLFNKVSNLCHDKDIDYKKLADISGVCYPFILDLKKNNVKYLHLVGKIARALDVDVNYFFDYDLNKISERIQYIRIKNCMNQVEFSKMLGVFRDTVRCWESEKNVPSAENIKKIDGFNLEYE